MINISTNLKDVIRQQKQTIESLQNIDKVFREAAFDSLAMITSRVQQEGKDAQEQNMKPYSKGYAKVRRQGGRQTDHKDLTFKGDLMRNFIVQPSGNDAYVIGFLSKRESDKAKWQEAREGRIFYLSQDEENFAVAKIKQKINQILNA